MSFDLRMRIGFLVSTIAMVVSLYFSEIMSLPPCNLCWYQRICMYPLVAIFGIGLFKNDRGAIVYAKLLASVGLVIAAYHCLLYYGIISEALAPCKSGVPCTQKQIEIFGFITIPILSLVSFLALVVVSSDKFTGRKNEK